MCFCRVSAVLLGPGTWSGSGRRFVVLGQWWGARAALGKQQRARADSCLAAPSAVQAIKDVKNRQQRF